MKSLVIKTFFKIKVFSYLRILKSNLPLLNDKLDILDSHLNLAWIHWFNWTLQTRIIYFDLFFTGEWKHFKPIL